MNKVREKNKLKWYQSPMFIIMLLGLCLYTVALFAPIIWGIMMSLQDGINNEYKAIPWPIEWKFNNYEIAFTKFYVTAQLPNGAMHYPTMIHMFGYSLAYSIGCALFATLIPCVVGYVTARFDYMFSRIINAFVIVVIALPIVGSQSSELALMHKLGLYNQIWGLWITKSHFLTMYYLIFYGTFRGFSKSFEEAAYIDGAGYFRTFAQIMMPLVKNLFLTIFLIQFIAFWNDYYTPLMYMPAWPTVAFGMYYFNMSRDNLTSNIPLKITGGVIMLIPVLVIFAAFNQRLMANLTIGGDKE